MAMFSRMRARKQKILLRHHADVGAQMHEIDLSQVHAIDLDHALIIGVQALEQTRDRGLARTAPSHDTQDSALRHLERNFIERIGRSRQ